jgi:uncharacterized membrane protein SpoIIM required for sporulation
MRQQRFEAEHRALWTALRGWLDQEPTLDPMDVPAAYRQLCDHLAVARERGYSLGLLEQLEQLALELHRRLYAAGPPEGRRIFAFVAREYPRLVRRQWRVVLASAAFFLLPLVGFFLLVRARPDAVHLLMSPAETAQLVRMYTPGDSGRMAFAGPGRDVTMFGFYVYHNIGLVFQCFASGLLGGAGPVVFLALNGLHGGAAMGLLTNHGLTRTFYGFVSGHSSFELTGAVLSGAAGLRMGIDLLHPGRRSRLQALKEGARTGGVLVLGAALLTFVAACFEGFWSAGEWLPWNVKAAVGLGLWILVLGWLALAGRGKA